MAWEARPNGRNYYYGATKRCGHVIKIYGGKGLAGEMAAALDAQARAARQQQLFHEAIVQAQSIRLDLAVRQLDQVTARFADMCLLISGNYPHGCEWIPRRQWKSHR